MTPQEALDALQSRIESYEASVALLPNYATPEMVAAIDVLAAFIKQVDEHGSLDLEWGEPGDCWERIANDDDIRDELKEAGLVLPEAGAWGGFEPSDPDEAVATLDAIEAKVKELGLGRHYGDPHCIWCLQGN